MFISNSLNLICRFNQRAFLNLNNYATNINGLLLTVSYITFLLRPIDNFSLQCEHAVKLAGEKEEGVYKAKKLLVDLASNS